MIIFEFLLDEWKARHRDELLHLSGHYLLSFHSFVSLVVLEAHLTLFQYELDLTERPHLWLCTRGQELVNDWNWLFHQIALLSPSELIKMILDILRRLVCENFLRNVDQTAELVVIYHAQDLHSYDFLLLLCVHICVTNFKGPVEFTTLQLLLLLNQVV